MSYTEDGWHYRTNSNAVFTGRGGGHDGMRVVARIISKATDQEAAYRQLSAAHIGRMMAASPKLVDACKKVRNLIAFNDIPREEIYRVLDAAIDEATGGY